MSFLGLNYTQRDQSRANAARSGQGRKASDARQLQLRAANDDAIIGALRGLGADEEPARATFASLGQAANLSSDVTAKALRRLAAEGRVEVSEPAVNKGWLLRLVDANKEPLDAVRRASASATLLAPGAPAARRYGALVALLDIAGDKSGRPSVSSADVAREIGSTVKSAADALKNFAEEGLVKRISLGSPKPGAHWLTEEGLVEAKRIKAAADPAQARPRKKLDSKAAAILCLARLGEKRPSGLFTSGEVARGTGYSDGTVRVAVAKLVKEGLATKKANKSGLAAFYRLTPEGLAAASAIRGSVHA